MVRTTDKEEINDKLQKEYCNRIRHIYVFLKENYPEYYAIGVLKVSEDNNVDRNLLWHNNGEDLVYSGLHIKFIKAFLAHSKMNANGKALINLMFSPL